MSRSKPVGTAKIPPLTPPMPRYAPKEAGEAAPTRDASSGIIGPRRLMKRPLLKLPKV